MFYAALCNGVYFTLIVTVHSYDLCIKHEILLCFKQSDIMILFTAYLCGVKFCESLTFDAHDVWLVKCDGV